MRIRPTPPEHRPPGYRRLGTKIEAADTGALQQKHACSHSEASAARFAGICTTHQGGWEPTAAVSCCTPRGCMQRQGDCSRPYFFLVGLLIIAGGLKAFRPPLYYAMGCLLCGGEGIERGAIS